MAIALETQAKEIVYKMFMSQVFLYFDWLTTKNI